MKSDPQPDEEAEDHEQNHSSEDTPARIPKKTTKNTMPTKKIFKMPLFLVDLRLFKDQTRK